jgi:hypothetical protein
MQWIHPKSVKDQVAQCTCTCSVHLSDCVLCNVLCNTIYESELAHVKMLSTLLLIQMTGFCVCVCILL